MKVAGLSALLKKTKQNKKKHVLIRPPSWHSRAPSTEDGSGSLLLQCSAMSSGTALYWPLTYITLWVREVSPNSSSKIHMSCCLWILYELHTCWCFHSVCPLVWSPNSKYPAGRYAFLHQCVLRGSFLRWGGDKVSGARESISAKTMIKGSCPLNRQSCWPNLESWSIQHSPHSLRHQASIFSFLLAHSEVAGGGAKESHPLYSFMRVQTHFCFFEFRWV